MAVVPSAAGAHGALAGEGERTPVCVMIFGKKENSTGLFHTDHGDDAAVHESNASSREICKRWILEQDGNINGGEVDDWAT